VRAEEVNEGRSSKFHAVPTKDSTSTRSRSRRVRKMTATASSGAQEVRALLEDRRVDADPLRDMDVERRHGLERRVRIGMDEEAVQGSSCDSMPQP